VLGRRRRSRPSDGARIGHFGRHHLGRGERIRVAEVSTRRARPRLDPFLTEEYKQGGLAPRGAGMATDVLIRPIRVSGPWLDASFWLRHPAQYLHVLDLTPEDYSPLTALKSLGAE
jgi:hypothetical protein